MNINPLLRPELDPLPERMRSLPIDRGYPVPWFVAWVDGKPEFRAMDVKKWLAAVKFGLCWVCGERVGSRLTFVIGPMCGINRTTSEPACHRECAVWSAKNCPFLSRPHMTRREDDAFSIEQGKCAGIPISRNPGVALLWHTRHFKVFNDGAGKPLIQVGEPDSVEWLAEGRPATFEQVSASVESGLPIVMQLAEAEGPKAVAELNRRKAYLETLYPSRLVTA